MKLPVYLSSSITQNINRIIDNNKNNPNAVSQWLEYIENLKSYISNPTIAFDYANRYEHYRNGAIHLVELEYDVTYIVKTNNYGQTYIYIFNLNLNAAKFGLKVPMINTVKQTNTQQVNTNHNNGKIKEHLQRRISQIITETIRTYISKECI